MVAAKRYSSCSLPSWGWRAKVKVEVDRGRVVKDELSREVLRKVRVRRVGSREEVG
jgi:hypothetical protein